MWYKLWEARARMLVVEDEILLSLLCGYGAIEGPGVWATRRLDGAGPKLPWNDSMPAC